MKKYLVLTILIALLSVSMPANASNVRSPVAVFQNTMGSYTLAFPIELTIDHSGLLTNFNSGITDWDTYLPTTYSGNPQHDLVGTYEWFSQNGVLTGRIIYDLGDFYTVDKLALWNEDAWGISQFSVYLDTDTDFSDATFGGLFNPINNPNAVDYAAEVFDLPSSVARYIGLDIEGVSGSPIVSMGEIAFSTTPVPIPSAIILMGTGLIGFLTARRRVKK